MHGFETSRREFLKTSAGVATGLATSSIIMRPLDLLSQEARPVVSVVRIEKDNVPYAIEKAIDLLGGIQEITKGKGRIMLKPNLVSSDPRAVTKPEVIKTLAQLMKGAGKDVVIGEGSAAAPGFNVKGGTIYRTKNSELLDNMQKFVFDSLGYAQLATSLKVPLINLHSGELVDVKVPNGFVFSEITLHRSLTDVDLLCSVPMMKTHGLAQVTLGMKNLIGAYPGTVYYAVRGRVHDLGAKVEPSGTAAAIVDMVRANKCGLVVVDASMAMEGQGPNRGPVMKLDLIVAGTNPLATDMVAARIMGFQPTEVPTFEWAWKAGMKPEKFEEIEVRGEAIEKVKRNFARPDVVPWEAIRGWFGRQEIA